MKRWSRVRGRGKKQSTPCAPAGCSWKGLQAPRDVQFPAALPFEPSKPPLTKGWHDSFRLATGTAISWFSWFRPTTSTTLHSSLAPSVRQTWVKMEILGPAPPGDTAGALRGIRDPQQCPSPAAMRGEVLLHKAGDVNLCSCWLQAPGVCSHLSYHGQGQDVVRVVFLIHLKRVGFGTGSQLAAWKQETKKMK